MGSFVLRRATPALAISFALSLVGLGCGSSQGSSSGSSTSASTAATPASTSTPTATSPGSTTTPGATTTPGTTTPGSTGTTPTTPATPAPSPSPTGTTVLVVCGLSQEQAAAQGPDVQIVLSDSDPAHLVSVLASTSSANLKAVVSFGIGGGLDPAYTNGQAMVATSVSADPSQVTLTGTSGSWTCDPTLVTRLHSGLQAGGINAALGLETCAESLAADNSPQAKAALRALTGANQVDMESHIAGQWAKQHGLPFVALRVVSDDAGTSLPPAALLPLTSSGSANYLAIVGSVLGNPAQIGQLFQAYSDSSHAFSVLGQCNSAFPLGGL